MDVFCIFAKFAVAQTTENMVSYQRIMVEEVKFGNRGAIDFRRGVDVCLGTTQNVSQP